MANLGTLWFGADVDLTALKKSIQEGNKDILNALKMDYDPQSFIKMVEKLQSELNNKTFNIQLSADGKSLTQAVGNIEKVVGDAVDTLRKSAGHVGNGGIAPFDLKNIEGAAQGIAGMKGNVIDLSKEILNRRQNVLDLRKKVGDLRDAWQQAIIDSGDRKSDAAIDAYKKYAEAVAQLRKDYLELSQKYINRGNANVDLRATVLATREVEKADKAYMKTVNDFTEQSKKAYAEREKAAAKASQTEKKSASDASAEWTRLEAIIARLNVLRDNALKAKVPTDGVDGLINKMKQLQSLYSEISLNNGRLSNGMLFKDLKGSANTKSAMHEISQVYTETNQKIRESNQLTRESEREAKAKAAAVSAAEKQIQREIDRSKRLYNDLTASIDRGKKASRDMSALESQQSRLNGHMMLLKNMTAADKENASLVEKRVKGIQDVRTETERLKKAEDELTRARERANKRNDNAALKNLKDEEKSVRDAWNRYEELKLKIREVEALKQRGVALKMDVSEIDSALVRLKDLRWQMSDIINNGGRRSTGKKLLTSELWSDSGKRELLNANAEIKNFTANLRETEKESRQADAGIKRLGMAFNELKGYIKQNGGSDEMRRLQSELQGAIQKMRQLMNAGDYKGAASVFERVSGNIRQAQVATRLYESSLRGASSGVSQLTEQERQLASSLKGSSDAMKGQSQLLGDLKAMATQYLGVWGAQAFVRNIIEIGGQLEMQRLSIGAILGDMAKADDLFGKIKNLAVKSPFGVVELDQMTKQLSAYGFEYNELFDMTKRLADISAATGTDVSRLALALGHVRSEAALSGYTLRQFSMANIPLAKKLSEHLSEVEGKLVSIADVRKRVRNKEIGYQEVLDVLKELTDEGGMFYNAQEIMSESVKAKFKNLKDSMDIMYGELAESAVGGVLKDVAAMLTTLTRHWEELGGVLLAVAGYWTIHKVSMVALSRATIEGNIAMGQFTAAQLEAQAVTGNLTRQQLLRAVASGKMAVADAQAAASVLGLTTAQLQLVRRTGDVSRAMTMATLSTSKYSITQLRLIASMRSVNLGWLAQGMVGIANGAKAAAVAVKGLFASMWPMLALSAIAEVFFSIKREQEEFAESANYVGQSARQMMKDLDDALNSIEKVGKPMDTEGLREAVKTMRDVLEQNEFYTKEQQAQVANAQTLSQKYDVLLQQMKDMREEAMFLANSEDLFKKIIENTGRHVVTNDSETYNPETGKYEHRKRLGLSFLNDSLTENMDEVNKADSQLQSSIQMLAEYQGVMEEAIKKNNNFGLSLDGKSWQEQIRLIAENGHWDEFVASVEGAGNRFEKTAANVKKASDDVRDKWDEVVNDDFEAIKLTIMEQLNLTEDQFNDWAKNNETALRWFADGIVRMVSKLGISQTLLDELKERFLNFFDFASKGKPTAVQPTQYDLQSDLAKQIIGNIVRSNAKNGKIVYGEKLIKEVNDLVGTGEHVKTVSEAVKAIKDRAQKDHDAMKDVEKIYGQTSKEYAAAKKKYEHSLEIAESNGISRSEIEKDKSKNTSKKEDSQAEKEAKAREKQFEERLKEAERQAKELRELEDVMAELGVASIADRGERERAQEELEFEKRKKQIAREADEMRKANYEAAKKAWEADAALAKQRNGGKPAGKAAGTAAVWADTEMAQQVLKDGGYGSVALTDAQRKKIEAEEKKVLIERERRIRESNEALVKEHQSYTDRKIEIEKEYKEAVASMEQAIADLRIKLQKATTDEEREQIQNQISALVRSISEAGKKRAESMADLMTKEWQQSPMFALAWQNMSRTSKETLADLKKHFQDLQNTVKDPQALEVVMGRINAINDQLTERNPFSVMKDALKDYETAVQKSDALKLQIDSKQASIKGMESVISIGKSMGLDITDNEKKLEAMKVELQDLLKSLGLSEQEAADATERLTKATDKSIGVINNLASSLQSLGSQIGGDFGDTISNIGGMFGSLGNAGQAMQDFANAKNMQGIAGFASKASSVISLASAYFSVFSTINDMLPSVESQYKKAAKKQAEINKMRIDALEVEISMMERRLQAEHYFATTSLQTLKDAAEVNKKNLEAYGAALMAEQEAYVEKSSGLKKYAAPIAATIAAAVVAVVTYGAGSSISAALIAAGYGLAAGAGTYVATKQIQDVLVPSIQGLITDGLEGAFKRAVEGISQYFTYEGGKIAAKDNLRVQTRHASFWRGEKTQDLESWVRENWGKDLWDEIEGVQIINLDVAHKLLESDVALVGETRQTVEELAEYAEKAQEFLQNIKDYVNEAFGPLSDNLVDALWTWYEEGTDVLDNFRDYASDTFKKLAQNILKTMLNTLIFDDITKKLEQLTTEYATGEIDEVGFLAGIQNQVNNLEGTITEKMPVIQQATTMVIESFDSMGYSISDAGSAIKENLSEIASSFKSALLDMESDAADFAKQMKEILYKTLVERFVMESPVVVTIDGEDKAFNSLNDYLDNWQERVDAVVKTLSPEEITNQIGKLQNELDEENRKYNNKKYDSQIASYQMSLDALDARWGWFSRNQGVDVYDSQFVTDEGRAAYEQMLRLQESINKLKEEQAKLDEEHQQRVAEIQAQIEKLQKTESLSDEERTAKIAELNAELEEQLALSKQIAKTYAEMSGWAIEQKIDASPFANLGDDILSVLNDTSKSVDDWKKEIVKSMTDDLVKELVYTPEFEASVRKLQEMYVNAMSGDEKSVASLTEQLKDYAELWDEAGNLIFDLSTTEGKEAFFKWLSEQMAGLATDAKKTADEINDAMGNIGDNDVETAFGDLRDKFKSTLTDMEADAESFRKDITKTLIEDLIEKSVLDVPLTLNIEGEDTTFDNFDKYGENWNARYAARIQEYNAAVKELNAAQATLQAATEAGDQQAIDMATQDLQTAQEHVDSIRDAIDALIDELVAVNAMTLEQAKQLRESLKIVEEDTTFTGLESSFVSALMDMDKDAEAWGQEIGQTLAQKIIEQTIVPTLIQPLLKEVQEAFDGAMEDNKVIGENGSVTYDWAKILGNDALTAALAKIQEQYPEIQEVVQKIMSLAGVDMSTTFSNSLDNLGDTLLDRLTSLDDDVEDMGKQIGETLMREMLNQMLATGPFAEKIEAIKKIWQNVLKSDGGAWVDTEGIFGETGAVYTLDKVLETISSLEDEMNNPGNGLTVLADKIKAMKETAEEAKDSFTDLVGTIVEGLGTSIDSSEEFIKSLRKQMTQQMANAIIARKYANEIATLQEEWQWALDGEEGYNVEEVLKRVLALIADINKDEEVTALIDTINELGKEADTTFSGMADSWASSLMGMKDTADDWAKDVGQSIAEKIIKEMVIPTMIQPYLDSLQNAINAALSADNATIQGVISAALPYLSDITAQYEAIQPLVEQIMNAFGIFRETEEEAEYALGDLRSEFVSALMDMEASAEDFSKSLSKILAQSFIDKFILGDAFDAQMEVWQQQYENIMNSGMSEDERRRQVKQLRDAIAYAKEGYVEEARAIQELLGLNAKDDQKATANIADKITYDQADQLLGINMAQEMTLEQILATIRGGLMLGGGTTAAYGTVNGQNALNQQILSALQGMQNATSVTGTGSDIFNRLGYTNEYLRAIRDSNDAMLAQFGNVLGQINSKLARL